MTALLLHKSGLLQGKRDTLADKVIRLGRSADNNIVFAEKAVSSYHAEMRRERDAYAIIDLGSTNGTFVNGRKVFRAALHDGDNVQLGEGGPIFELRTRASANAPRLVPISSVPDQRDSIVLHSGKVTLGRSRQNDVVAGREYKSLVSRKHARITVGEHNCELEDLGTPNGTLLNGHSIRKAHLEDGDVIEIGRGGPKYRFHWNAERGKPRINEEQMLNKIEHAARNGRAGERTKVLLRLAQKYHERQLWPYLLVSACSLVIAGGLFAGSYLILRRVERTTALNRFYETRNLGAELVGQNNLSEAQKIGLRARRRELDEAINKYLEKVDWFRNKSPQEREVMRLARNLGETELDIPDGFFSTVMQYVSEWKNRAMLQAEIEWARRYKPDLIKLTHDFLVQRDLPPEFLFIALQESSFRPDAVGDMTRYGPAKGMWQLLPPTARSYGLNVGPLEKEQRTDPSDDRHNPIYATKAAMDYLVYLYSTKAAASGLLVIAAYNYGETRILNRLDTLPAGPRERNFWNFYRRSWLPDETKKHVMRIFSAALICENPSIFGFQMTPIQSSW